MKSKLVSDYLIMGRESRRYKRCLTLSPVWSEGERGSLLEIGKSRSRSLMGVR